MVRVPDRSASRSSAYPDDIGEWYVTRAGELVTGGPQTIHQVASQTPYPIRNRLQASRLLDIADKLDAGERLTLDDGRRLFESDDLLGVGWLANRDRERRHGDQTF